MTLLSSCDFSNTYLKNITLKDLKGLCPKLLKTLKTPRAFLLSGPLGSGKTTFVKTLLASSSSGEEKAQATLQVSSPSFAIQHEYTRPFKVRHMDLYRLKNAEDLESTGFWDIFDDTHYLLVIEWWERLSFKSLPQNWNYLKIRFDFSTDPKNRNLHINKQE